VLVLRGGDRGRGGTYAKQIQTDVKKQYEFSLYTQYSLQTLDSGYI